MRSSDFVVRKFRSATLERAFRVDCARRYAGHRRMAGTILILLIIAFGCHDWLLFSALDPGMALSIAYVRLAGTVAMAIPLWFLWGHRAFDERWAVRLLFVLTLSCWLTLERLRAIYPLARVFREISPTFVLVIFVIFTSFRLRAITAAWLVGVCVASYLTAIRLWPRGSLSVRGLDWFSRSTMVSYMYIAGILVSIQFERTARREFMSRRMVRAAKARIEAASLEVNRQNERMRELVKEKERFFSSAYHDIQQPLAAINLFIHSARTKLESNHAVSHDLDIVEETACDLLDMFKDIQDYSELGSYTLKLTSVDTWAVLTDVVEQHREPARLKGIELRISARARRPSPIETDRSLFKRVLSNFVSNAIKNTSSGGVVIGWAQIEEQLRIDVRDTGVGISPEHRDAIFDEYFQIDNPGRDRSKGLGLGLSIVKRIVDILPMHSMRFWSVKGRGSRFSLYAPVANIAPVIERVERTSDAYTAILKDKYVLLCDDDPLVLEGLRQLFLGVGARVDTAESMTEIEAFLIDGSRPPDVTVTDIRLRDGHTGIDVAERIRRHFAWAGVLPVAFITGELVSPPALRKFPKPFVLLRKSSTPENMLAEVRRFVADAQPIRFGQGWADPVGAPIDRGR
ncbi:Na+/proline symporter / Sensor histidine kinase PrlS [Caballeronia sordidicola]|uniref:histidine kinase n=2 Tax=Caballeronia sordidicola TaxID=196367 RepID=A0A242MXF0_CABSO|nr:Na+/proline symporter / Sensor histidine kinase PrlS [Caballeronia sordidicola]